MGASASNHGHKALRKKSDEAVEADLKKFGAWTKGFLISFVVRATLTCPSRLPRTTTPLSLPLTVCASLLPHPHPHTSCSQVLGTANCLARPDPTILVAAIGFMAMIIRSKEMMKMVRVGRLSLALARGAGRSACGRRRGGEGGVCSAVLFFSSRRFAQDPPSVCVCVGDSW
jgi:hypothetical protein